MEREGDREIGELLIKKEGRERGVGERGGKERGWGVP